MHVFGAVIGDIVGSRYEFANHRSKDFALFDMRCSFTDDSLMTIAVAEALTKRGSGSDKELADATIASMRRIAAAYPDSGWGTMFSYWLFGEGDPAPYNSFGNGAAMRVSPVGWYAKTEDEVRRLSRIVTGVSHNHPEGLKGAECTAMAVFDALGGKSKRQILERAASYYPELPNISCDELRKTYLFDESCMRTVPQAFACFAEGQDFEDVLRNAISVGGDSDTLAAIACSVADAFYGVPERIEYVAEMYLTDDLKKLMSEFFDRIGR